MDGFRNKNIVANLVTVLFLVVFYKWLPALGTVGEPPRLFVYDAGHSALVAGLAESTSVEVRRYPSQEQMEQALADRDVVELGLVVPAGFDRTIASGGQPALDGYVVHWTSAADAGRVKSQAEREISALAGQVVRINLSDRRVYPQPNSRGLPFVASSTLVLVIALLGTIVAPHLMIEEKQTRTMDALLVSPARIGQIVAGKALAGLFYCLTAGGLVLAFHFPLVLHWGLAVLATVCGSLFIVALGLLLGSVFKVRQQLTLWGFILLNVLLVPVFLSVMTEILPAALVPVLTWMPGVALARAVQVSFSGRPTPSRARQR